MTALSALLPVVTLLVFNNPTSAKLSCMYMYFIAPFITLRFLGYKFIKAKNQLKKRKNEIWLLDGKKYKLSRLNTLTFRNFAVVFLSLCTIPFFNKLYLPIAQPLILAGPYLLIHGFFFVKGEPLSILKSFVPLPNSNNILNRSAALSLYDPHTSNFCTREIQETFNSKIVRGKTADLFISR